MHVVIGPQETVSFHQQGNRFWYRTGAGPIEAKLRSGGDTRTYRLHAGQGVNLGGARFDSLEILNPGDVDLPIEFDVLEREVFDSRFPGDLQVAIKPSAGAVTLSDVQLSAGADYTLPAGSRVAVTVYALPDNQGFLRVGPGAAAGVGYPMTPGGSYRFETTAEITVFAEDVAGGFGMIEEFSQ